MSRLTPAAVLALVLSFVAASVSAGAQAVKGVIVDQTGLPLPGATVQLFDGSALVSSTVTDADGSFTIEAGLIGDIVVVSLDGFETARVARADIGRIVLAIARAVETTTVVGATEALASPTAPTLGTTLTANTVSRMPSSKLKAKESLPLLPSVIRGPDGLMRIGGARAHETPLFLDGFNITDPATGISSVNLPFEAVREFDVLTDPMAVTYGGLLGGMMRMESKPGGDTFVAGVQGFVPRPRLESPGFGRIEGIFPRVYAGGTSGSGRVHYFTALEYDYERIPVPDVTQASGPDIVEQSATLFARVDAQLNPRNALTLETLVFPSSTDSLGLSPRRAASATSNLSAQDVFAGATHHFMASPTSLFTIQLGVLAHETTLEPNGTGVSYLTPAGWYGNWFSAVTRTATRVSAVASWERIATLRGKTHDFTMSGEVSSRRLRGQVAETPIVVQDSLGRPTRTIGFGPPSSVSASDRPVAVAFRDVWQVNERTRVDGGVRLDHSVHGGGAPSGRVGARFALDRTGVTVLKAGYGSFIGTLPLAVPAFGGHPIRVDRSYDPASGDLVSEITMQPTVGDLRLPKAVAATIGVERQIVPGVDAQLTLTARDSSRLATLRVPTTSGPMPVESTGSSSYREVQVSLRRTWRDNQQVFVSYVRSTNMADTNDFASTFQNLDAPLLQPGGSARAPSDARHRVLAWGTFNLPNRVVLSPVAEWRSGFPWSSVDARYFYATAPNSQSYPNFVSLDMIVYKTVTVRKASADLGVQVFNVTNHDNPRDVYSVVGAPQAGQFVNSVGPIFRGYMLIKW